MYKAIENHSGRKVAIKKMARVKHGQDMKRQALQEARTIKVLRHETIIECFETLKDKDYYYFVMELMDCSLYDLIRMLGGKLAEREAALAIRHIAQGVQYMHQ